MSPPSLTDAQRRALNRQLRDEAWRRGDLSHLLHKDQLYVLGLWLESTAGRFVLEIGRRWGKTYLLVCIAFMVCLRRPGCRVVYGAPTLKHLKEFVLPAVDKIAADAPEHLKPRFNNSNSHIEFANGSWVHLFGCDDQRQADTGAGNDADLALFDEAGATGVAALLAYVIKSIFRPSLLMTGGRILLSSSPARVPEHEFTVMAEQAEVRGAYVRRTMYDNPRLGTEQRELFIAEDAADEALTPEQYRLTDTFRREYLAERVIDKLLVVLPEWEAKRATLIRRVERPEFFDSHVIYDPGGVDPHFLLFGYWHFAAAKWVIEGELCFTENENTSIVAEAIKAKERQLWGTDRWEGTLFAFEQRDEQLWNATPEWMREKWAATAPRNPRVRWMDTNIDKCRDLYSLHGLAFVITQKTDLEAQVNNLRVMIAADEVWMSPECINLDADWRRTTWANHRRKDFARRSGRHGDGVACGVYGGRNLDRQRNPNPPGYRGQPGTKTFAQKWGDALSR